MLFFSFSRGPATTINLKKGELELVWEKQTKPPQKQAADGEKNKKNKCQGVCLDTNYKKSKKKDQAEIE